MCESGRRRAVGHALKHELLIWGFVSSYLFILFSAVAAYVWAKSGTAGHLGTEIGAAALRAIVLGKFVLMGKIFGVGTMDVGAPLAHRALVRSVALLLLVALFVVVEEAIVSLIHGGTAREGLQAVRARGGADLLTSLALFYLILLPLALLQEVVRNIPPESLAGHLFARADG